MAHPTKEDAEKPASMAHTPGVSPLRSTDPVPVRDRVQQMGRPFSQGPIQTQDTKPADPILFADIEPGLLARVHPRSFTDPNNEAAREAMEQGWETHDAGWHLRANADEGQEYDSGTLAAPTDQPASTRPQTAPSRPNEGGMHGEITAAGEAFPLQQHADTTPQRGQTPHEREQERNAAVGAQQKPHEDDKKKAHDDDDKHKPRSK
jgi:hypothetical protein